MTNHALKQGTERIAGLIAASSRSVQSVAPRSSPHGELTEFDVELVPDTNNDEIDEIDQAIRQALAPAEHPHLEWRARLRIAGRLCRIVEGDLPRD